MNNVDYYGYARLILTLEKYASEIEEFSYQEPFSNELVSYLHSLAAGLTQHSGHLDDLLARATTKSRREYIHVVSSSQNRNGGLDA